MEEIILTAVVVITIGTKPLISGSKVIIDDILLWCDINELTIIYFYCVCEIFRKYRVSFCLDKCEFLKSRVEYVGHDIFCHGNCLAQSKFDLINDWPIPTSRQSFFSFIGLVNFYHRFAPYLELRLKALRKLVKFFYRNHIPPLAWTKELTELFKYIKFSITSSPVLAWFNPSKITFLKTDWSSEGMGWVLMQPDNDDVSTKAATNLKSSGICEFDLAFNGAQLKSVAFGLRGCNDNKRNFHSFIGKGACGRWAIAQNRKYLWGCHFY